MNGQKEDFAARRRELADKIARQRTEFSQAYARLEQPIRYTDYGLRGFGFIRSNPWIFAALPAAVGVIKILWGGNAKKDSSRGGPPPDPFQAAGGRARTGFGRTASTVGSYAWRLFQLYRRIRPYFP